MQVQSPAREIKSLTGIRGIAAIHVMLFHYFLGLQKFHPGTVNPLTTFVGHGYLEVDLFFVLSGFVMALNYGHLFEERWSIQNYRKFLFRRIARVYPLYLVTTILAAVFVLAGWIEGPANSHLLANFFLSLFMVQGWAGFNSFNPPAWSISTEWFAYLIFPVILVPCLFIRPHLTASLAVVGICVVAIFFVFPPPFMVHRETAFALDTTSGPGGLLRCVAEFSLGVLCFRLSELPFIKSYLITKYMASIVSLLLILLFMTPKTDLLIVLLFPILVIALLSRTDAAARILASRIPEFAGDISYSIYLTHYLLFGVIGWVHTKANHMGFAHGQMYGAMVGFMLELPLAYGAYWLIELPARNWLRTFFEGTKAPRVVTHAPS